MPDTADISPTIVEALYCEALALADETRSAFEHCGRTATSGPDEDLARIALSCEALRTTTRMMQAIAWLLNQRAYFAGELSEFQLRRHGRLPPVKAGPDPLQMALLADDVVELIERTQHFYERIARLDRAWRETVELHPAVHRLQARLGGAVARL